MENLLVQMSVLWVMTAGLAHMVGGKKWAKKVWDAPFTLIGNILGWLLASLRQVIASAISATWRAIRDAWRRRNGDDD